MPKLTADTITLRMADLFVMLPAEKRGEALGMLRGIEYAQRKTVAPEAPAAEQAELLSDGKDSDL